MYIQRIKGFLYCWIQKAVQRFCRAMLPFHFWGRWRNSYSGWICTDILSCADWSRPACPPIQVAFPPTLLSDRKDVSASTIQFEKNNIRQRNEGACSNRISMPIFCCLSQKYGSTAHPLRESTKFLTYIYWTPWPGFRPFSSTEASHSNEQ